MGERSVGQREPAKSHGHLAPAHVEVHGWSDIAAGEEGIGHAERSQHLQGAGVHDKCTRRAERLEAALHEPHLRSVIIGLQRKGEPRRAGTGDQDVDRLVMHGPAPRP